MSIPFLLKVESIVDFYTSELHKFLPYGADGLQVKYIVEQAEWNGVFPLPDCVSCIVTEERNGAYELNLQYPITGFNYSEIELMAVVLCKPNPNAEPQYFRIMRISKPMNGIVSVYCSHISYDLSGYPVLPYSATNAGLALNGLISHAATPVPFTVWTDLTTSAQFRNLVPSSFRSLLGGQDGSILDSYGGEYEFDNFVVKLHSARGLDRGVSIAYGKNLTDLRQEEECANVYTGVCPFWSNDDGSVVVQLDEKIIPVEGTFTFTRILTLDLSGSFDEAPTKAQLKSRAESYIRTNKIGVPKVSLKLSFVQLAQLDQYKDMAFLERVNLCDTVHVSFEKLGVNATAKCVRTEFNVLLDRYESIELGEARANLASTIAQQTTQLESVPTTSELQQAVSRATGRITGNSGGFFLMRDANLDGEIDELLFMDTPDINTAQKVWRWNMGGLGHSNTGVDGEYPLAITADGEIVADWITTGNLNASLIKAGTITNNAGNMTIDVTNGIIKTTDTRFIEGQTVSEAEYSGISNVTRINGKDATYVGINANKTGGLIAVLDSNGRYRVNLTADGSATLGDGTRTRVSLDADGLFGYDASGAHKFGVSNTSVVVNGVSYTPMNIDYKDSRGANQTMRILCAGLI